MSWKGPLNKIGEYRFEIPSSYRGEKDNLKMRTSAVIYANDEMIPHIRGDNAPEQTANVAVLPGIVGKSLAMPDIHWGYGFPIGGVAATDAEEGVISPGGVGFDINCGVRLLRTNLQVEDIKTVLRELIDTIFINVPSGLGEDAKIKVSRKELDDVMRLGAGWAVEHDYGWSEDLEYLEEKGCMKNADPAKISEKARQRGDSQLGSLGAGNHFLEIQKVEEIYDQESAKVYGIKNKGQIMIMIHTGSRGFGHQVCTDYIQVLDRAVKKYNIWLPDRQLACAPVKSREGEDYIKAMACAANFAWCNRQMITHWVRESFQKVLGRTPEDMDMGIVYDVAHNIAKLEEHIIEGKKRMVYVHRKGATRAFGPGRTEIPLKYRDTGQPVLIPGDMGSESYILKGTNTAEETFSSTCHGAGRVMSRNEALRRWRGEHILNELKKKNIYVHPASLKVLAEEAPDAYKRVGDVVNVVHGARLSLKVAKLIPLGVVKG
ncbi:MAG: RtcB family protein [Candidatus Thermoplasmatota archaeon]